MTDIHWHCSHFNELKLNELYEILALRQEVFVLEQKCFYQDLDGLDQDAFHVTGRQDELVAYTRILKPGVRYKEVAFGRVLTKQSVRGMGVGRELIAKTIEFIENEFSTSVIKIAAQQHLEKFYQDFGFSMISEPYLEDDIPHIEMLRE